MSNFYYYQKVGGDEAWKIVPESGVSSLPPHMFRTILSLDTAPNDDTTKEEYAAIKYSGPLYFDLDDSNSPASTAKYTLALVEKLRSLDVSDSTISVFASGGKGFHVLVPQSVFIDKVAKGYKVLPAIYKEIAFELAVNSMDFRVYTARKGRMLRMPNIQRENGRYKVQITIDELTEIANLPPEQGEERYKSLCSEPRDLWPAETSPKAFGLMAVFDRAQKKVEAAAKRVAKMKPVSLPDELPSFEAMLQGEGILADVGFHNIAMQIAITAHTRNMTRDELVEAAEGLIQNHESDGSRYNTEAKRRREIGRMFDYTEDNPCYQYSAPAIRSLLSHKALDLAGVAIDAEEFQQGLEEGNSAPEASTEFAHAGGVELSSQGVMVPAEGGMKQILPVAFQEPTELVSAKNGTTLIMQARIKTASRDLGLRSFDLETFSSAAALNKVMMPLGQAYMGNDQQAKGVYLKLVEKSQREGNKVYVVTREGLDFVSMPFHHDEAVRKGLMIFADQESVIRSKEASQIPDFNLRYVGYPNPQGLYQSDLSLAPRMADVVKDEEQLEQLRSTLWNLLMCQTPSYLSKMIGWSTACHYRMLFHTVYRQFPLLHINGAAGAGKTSMIRLIANLHYYRREALMLTPSSTLYAIKEAVAASSSIPLIVDEYKPAEMRPDRHNEFKLLFRDAYNCREVSRGGGSRESADVRTIQSMQLSAPICFVAEAAESEPAVMERVVLLTLVEPPAQLKSKYFEHFSAALEGARHLGVLGAYMAKRIVSRYSPDELRKEFDDIYKMTRKDLMLQPGMDELSESERAQRTNTKERTAFNYAVLRFGLLKFEEVVRGVFNGDTNTERKFRVEEVIKEMFAESASTVLELQQQTTPEWLKVLNTFADIAAGGGVFNAWSIRNKKEYILKEQDGRPTLELSLRQCYGRYRMYCAQNGMKPLFSTETAFIHAMNHVPGRVVGAASELDTPGGSATFDLGVLRNLGFIDMPTKQ